jgi:hypothetical protein
MRRVTVMVLAAGLSWSTGCGSSDVPTRLPYKPGSTAIIGGQFDNPDGLAVMNVSTPSGDACIDLDGACVKPQTECGADGTADVLLDDNGAVVDVICYPNSGVSVESFEGDVHKVGNDVVLVFDDQDDGVDVDGDVTIDGNNVTLYGHGPDVSVIGGDLHIDKNNSLVRGIRVQGDVVIDKNNPSMVDCVIEGDLTIKGNNVSVALCEVWGKLVIEGNNAVLVSNRFRQPPEVQGKNLVCSGNVAFDDANADNVIDPDELGAAIDCSNAEPAAKSK